MNELPAWRDVREPGSTEPLWECDDDHQQQFKFASEFYGFDLPRFDLWLSGLPDGRFKSSLLERRGLAAEALMANNHDVGVLQLEVMVEAWRRERREEGLLPLARAGKRAEEVDAKRQRNILDFNANKKAAMARAEVIAAAHWSDDVEHAIRIGDMSETVWGQMLDEGWQEWLPDTTVTLRDWIKPVAPDYATRGGRPSKKPSPPNRKTR